MSTSQLRPREAKCPICKAPAVQDSRPFCSKRCKDIDLARWLGGGYAIAGGNADADEDGDGQPEHAQARSTTSKDQDD